MFEGMPIEVKDYRGLLCGFLLVPQAPAQPLEWNDEGMEILSRPDLSVWLHFNLTDSRSRNWIASCDRIPKVARELLLSTNPHIQLEILEDGFVGVIGDLDYDFNADPDSLGLLRIYVDRECAISVRKRPLKGIDKLRRDLNNGKSIESSMDLMVELLALLNDMFANIVTDLREVVEDMEDQTLKGNSYPDRRELSRVRRLLVRLRRHLIANNHALTDRLMPRLPAWCRESEESELRRNLDLTSAIIQDLDLVQERAKFVQDEMSNRLQETVNRNLYMLSIVTTIFMPITLITGVFGMNIGGIPWTQDPMGFLWSLNLMGLTLAIVFIILKRQHFF